MFCRAQQESQYSKGVKSDISKKNCFKNMCFQYCFRIDLFFRSFVFLNNGIRKIGPICPTVSLKKSIPYSQILLAKIICSTNSEFKHNCKVQQEQFTKRGYDSSSIATEIKKIKLLDKKHLLTPKTTQKVQVLSLTVTYNHTLPNIKQIISKSLVHLKDQ